MHVTLEGIAKVIQNAPGYFPLPLTDPSGHVTIHIQVTPQLLPLLEESLLCFPIFQIIKREPLAEHEDKRQSSVATNPGTR
jgi:hypothetical protein